MTNTAILASLAGSLSALSLGAWLFMHSERFGALPAGGELEALRLSPNWCEEEGRFRNPLPTPRMADDAGFLRTLAEYVLTPRPYAAPEMPIPSVKPDLALLECGQYDRRWPFIHMKPEETAQAAEDLRCRALFPSHNGKFCIAYHGWREPLERVSAASVGRPYRLLTPRIGEMLILKDSMPATARWWE